MSAEDLFERVIALLGEAALDDTRWPAAADLINEVAGTRGNVLALAEGHSPADGEIILVRSCFDGRRREDWEREYLEKYWPQDECAARISLLPDGELVHNADLYSRREKRTSPTYTEARRRSGMRNGLTVRLDGPGGSHIVWSLADPIEPEGWSPERIETIERLLPHVRQFACGRRAVEDARAAFGSLAGLLDTNRAGVVQLDRRGRIVAASPGASDLLRRDEGLVERDGFLSATEGADDAQLQTLVARALSSPDVRVSAGSMTVGRPSARTRLVVCVSPVVAGEEERFGASQVGALVLVADPERRPHIDPELVATAMGLGPAESQVAAMLAAGQSVRDIAAATDRSEGTVRWHLKHIFRKQGITRQAELVQRVLSLDGLPGSYN